MKPSPQEIKVADSILIGYVIARSLLASLNPFRKFTHGRVHEIAKEGANIAFTACEYRKLYLADGMEYWAQAAKCGFVTGGTWEKLNDGTLKPKSSRRRKK